MKSKITIILLVLIVGEIFYLFGGNFNFVYRSRLSQLISEKSPNYLSGEALITENKRWSEIMDLAGPNKGYAYFKEEYKSKGFGTQHLMAHLIGSMLYKKEGIKGQGICDGSFAFGCYHSFFAEALIDKGTAIIEQLNQVCLDKFGPLGSGCQHGIGHGVMDFFGKDKLLEALQACEGTTATTPIAGCTSGVFMEYNVPIVISSSTAVLISRPISEKNPYDPCPALPDKYRASCYYSNGQWWNQTTLYHNKWREQGLLCKNIPNPKYMDDCFIGIGNVAAPDNFFDVEKTIESCKQMPNPESIVLCQAGASWSFDANKEYQSLAVKMCEKLGEADHLECLRRGNLLNPENNQ